MDRNGKSALRVGLAVGRGTGSELADVFETVVLQLASRYSVDIELHRSSRIYHTYLSLLSACDSQEDIHNETIQDTAHYERFCEEEATQGTRVIFRTAITAESLYLVRQHLEAVKVERFDYGWASMLLVRDQAQGFYTGSNNVGEGTVSHTCHFRKELIGRIISYSLDRARQIWLNCTIDSITMVYKYHLFGGIFDAWAKELSKEFAIKIELVQPDTMNRNLLAFGIQGRQLIIAGNEYADIMQVILLNMFGQGVQEINYAENVYLHPQLSRLCEYQTVHGSADNLVGKGIVNPTATIKAAAAILERHGNCKGLEEAINRTIRTLAQQNAATPDQGGYLSTTAFVDAVLGNLTSGSLPSNSVQSHNTMANKCRVSMGKKTALVVMDFQNDFLTERDTAAGSLAHNTQLVTDFIRTQHHEVIFVRFIGNAEYQLPNWQYRDFTLGRKPNCLENSVGAEISPLVQPAAGEQIFDKHACFDAFLCDGFGRYLQEEGYRHLVMVGLYCDVCVDSTARTAFQKGFFVTVVSDCTRTLHLPVKDSLEFMRKVYGARVVSHGDLLDMEA